MAMNITGLRAAAAGAVIVAAGLAGAAFAHPHEEGAKGEKAKVIVITERVTADGKDKAKGEHVRRFRIEHDGHGKPGEGKHVRTIHIERDGKGGPGAHAFVMGDGHALDCADGDKLVDETAGDDKEKTKVVLCTKGATPAQRAERLEQALSKISSNSEISAEHKARITAALRAAIDRARAAR